MMRIHSCFVAVACVLAMWGAAGEDWPTYRHDNARSGITGEQLEAPLSAQWVFTPIERPQPAWPEEGKEKTRVRFDEAFHVVAAGDAVYFGSSADNKVYCLDAATGEVRWSAFTGGPVRVAPALSDGRVYAGSDDGYAYCWQANDGAPVWKVKASFRDDKVLGNGKMISLWPVRTGILVDKGVAYFAAGVFPHEGLFLCAVKADDGTVIWRNDGFGEEGYKVDFGGISPQGALLASESALFLPSGRAMPAAFSRADGRFQYYAPADHIGGTWALLAGDRLVAGVDGKRGYIQEGGSRDQDAAYAWFPGLQLVVAPDLAYMLTADELAALDRNLFKTAAEQRARIDAQLKPLSDQLKLLGGVKGKATEEARATFEARRNVLKKQIADLNAERKRVEDGVYRWRRPCGLRDALILSGGCLYAGGANAVTAALAKTGEEVWKADVDGRACGLAVANGRLFVSTDAGKIYVFDKTGAKKRSIVVTPNPNAFPQDDFGTLCAKAAEDIIAITGVTKGYCLDLDCGTGRLAYELAKRTELKIIGMTPDRQQAEAARKMLDAAGVYGSRVVVDEGDPAGKLPYADYFANLIVSERALTGDVSAKEKEEFLPVLKPLGGVACFGRPANAAAQGELPDMEKVRAWLDQQGAFTANAVTDRGRWLTVTRGALPGAGKWTHQYADSGNTACSDDQLVKGSLGVLWFGQPGASPMVERHARPAAPVAMDGRMFIQGENVVMAYDAYNGMPLWEQRVPGALRVRVDSDMGNLAVEKDGLYVATGDKCIRLNPATGETVHTYMLPPHGTEPRRWGYIACSGQTLFGSVAAPFKEEYGAFWDDAVGENGEWKDLDTVYAKRGITGEARDDSAEFFVRHAKPDDGAFWEAQRNGLMWRMMTSWPAWGSVTGPEGAVTERIMASSAFFAVNAETGDILWKYEGKAIAHPAIAIGDGTVFLADCDASAEQKQAAMAERQALIAKGTWDKEDITYDEKAADVRRVVALDAGTGAKRWERVMDLTGCGGDRMGLAYKDGVLCFFGCFSNHDRRYYRDGKLAWRRIKAMSGKDGADLWSRPLNYLRRPVIVGDSILIEPRACDLHTGAIKTRLHPLTGQETPWEFVRPGHCCSITSAAPNMFFLRGGFLWYFDLLKDEGMLPFGGIRPGCWINVIPANGLVLFPEASAGCTCSFPVRSTVVLEPKKEARTRALYVQHGSLTPVRHMAVSFGAPGDWRDDAGTLWFAYPHPPSTDWYEYGVKFALEEQFVSKASYFSHSIEGSGVKGVDKPWLFASGASGITSFTLPLLDEGQGPGAYSVRLYFAEPEHATPGKRVFTVRLQDKAVLDNFDIVQEAGGPRIAVVKEFSGIPVQKGLRVDLVPKEKDAAGDALPLINAIEAIREDARVAQLK